MRDKRTSTTGTLAGQEGMVLLSTLLILSAVSLIAVGMSGDTTTALQVAGNRRLTQQAFHLADGGADDPATDAWRPLGIKKGLPAIEQPTAAWTGTLLIIWGSGKAPAQRGLIFDPANNSWENIVALKAPDGFMSGAYLMWTGSEVIVRHDHPWSALFTH